MAEEYYEIGPSINNMDFYIGGTNISLIVSAEVNVQPINASIIKNVTSSININTSLSSSSERIAQASSSLSFSLNKTATTLEILNVLLHAHISLDATATSNKTTFASSSISINTSLTSSIIKTTFGSAHIHNELTSTINSIAIRNTNSIPLLSINVNMLTLSHRIIAAIASLSILNKILINPPIKFSPNYIDSGLIRALLIIDDKPITNHNRVIDVSHSPVYVENKNWNNTSRRYYKRSSTSEKAVFSLSWSFLPNFREKTVDQRLSRDYLISLAEDPDIHVLKIINQDENNLTPYTETSYNVFVRNYSESLIRRDLQDGVYYFDCSLTLEEA